MKDIKDLTAEEIRARDFWARTVAVLSDRYGVENVAKVVWMQQFGGVEMTDAEYLAYLKIEQALGDHDGGA